MRSAIRRTLLHGQGYLKLLQTSACDRSFIRPQHACSICHCAGLRDGSRGDNAATSRSDDDKEGVVSVAQVEELPADPLLDGSGDLTRPKIQMRSASNFYQRIAQWKHRWTRTHSYFALMDGFVLDTGKMPINLLD